MHAIEYYKRIRYSIKLCVCVYAVCSVVKFPTLCLSHDIVKLQWKQN